MKTVLLLLILVTLHIQTAIGQKIQIEGFVRLPQVVNVDFTSKTAMYSPVISAGATLRCQRAFADIGVFMNKNDVHGYYTYFGSSIYTKALDSQWTFVNNWFGEVTLFPRQQETTQTWLYTAGVSPVLVHPLSWGTFAVALTAGVAFSDDHVSLNSRLILNCSIPISK
jgi:hypothetical protein